MLAVADCNMDCKRKQYHNKHANYQEPGLIPQISSASGYLNRLCSLDQRLRHDNSFAMQHRSCSKLARRCDSEQGNVSIPWCESVPRTSFGGVNCQDQEQPRFSPLTGTTDIDYTRMTAHTPVSDHPPSRGCGVEVQADNDKLRALKLHHLKNCNCLKFETLRIRRAPSSLASQPLACSSHCETPRHHHTAVQWPDPFIFLREPVLPLL